MKTNTERSRDFRDAARQTGEIRQINLWLPNTAIEQIDQMAKHERISRAAVVLKLVRERQT